MSSFWKGRRVFVTGATGMIGAWLVKELLSEQAAVTALVMEDAPASELCRSGDIRRVGVVKGRLEDFEGLTQGLGESRADTVFHLAAQPIVTTAQTNPLPTFEANIRGTYHLLEACRLRGDTLQNVVIASSDKAYGEQPRLPYTEDMPLTGRHPYEVSKSCADLLAQSYHHTYGLPVAIARCGNVYGGGDLNWNRIVPGTIRSLLRGEHPIIRSDGSYLRDYIYVKDVACAYMRLAECCRQDPIRGQAFNFSTESPLTVSGLVHKIQKLMGQEDLEPDIQNCATGEILHQSLSAAKARTLLGWKPKFPMETGLRETIEWYRGFLAS